MTHVIDGKAFAAGLREKIKSKVARLAANHSVKPGLAVVLVGEDPASEVYVRNKGRQTKETGMASFEHKLDKSTSQQELVALVEQLNADSTVNGILVQLPLPDQIDADAVISTISPEKDVDGFHVINVGRLTTGAEAMIPCTPLGSMMMLEDAVGDLSGKHAVVVGRSNIVGKPMASLLLAANCTVTIAHSRTQDLPAMVRQADIVVAAVGRPEMVRGDWITSGRRRCL